MSNQQWNSQESNDWASQQPASGGEWGQPQEDWTRIAQPQGSAQEWGQSAPQQPAQDWTQASLQTSAQDWSQPAPQSSAQDWSQAAPQASVQEWGQPAPQSSAQDWGQAAPQAPAQDWNQPAPQSSAQDWGQAAPQAPAQDWGQAAPQAPAQDWNQPAPQPSGQDWGAVSQPWGPAPGAPAPGAPAQWQQPPAPVPAGDPSSPFDFSFRALTLPRSAKLIFILGILGVCLEWLFGVFVLLGGAEYYPTSPMAIVNGLVGGLGGVLFKVLVLRVLIEIGMAGAKLIEQKKSEDA